MDVSVIIVNYNTLKMTSDCIESVLRHTAGLQYEIILVDNASTDGSREHFSAMEGIRYIYNEENLGFGRANNEGLKYASGRNILFLNSDTVVLDNSIAELSRHLDENPRTGACGGNLVTPDLKPCQSFHRYRLGAFYELNILLHYLPQKLLYGKNIEYNYTRRPLKVGYIIGADLIVPRRVLDEAGAFNPAFFLFFEETELCWRIARAGYRIECIPDSKIVHIGGATTKGTPEKDARRRRQFEESRHTYMQLTHGPIGRRVTEFLHKLHKK